MKEAAVEGAEGTTLECSYGDGPIAKPEKRRKDKSDTATVDKVLDRRTVAVLSRLVARGKLFELSGAVSSGKEANVYTARCSTALVSKFIRPAHSPRADQASGEVVPVVLKIYKTSAMLFRDRARYIVDEKRFKSFCTSNSRKLIKLWAEKEVRNLRRLGKAGIPCPEPLYLKRSILVMSMVGGVCPAPRLRDVALSSPEWEAAYKECVGLIRDMYQKARLVHGDFSEYNLLYCGSRVYVIDVGQSMDIYQENSNTFLMVDICNCNEFFERKGVAVRHEVELFEDVTGLRVPEYLKVDGRLNKECFIPTRIIEVANSEDIGLFVEDRRGIAEIERGVGQVSLGSPGGQADVSGWEPAGEPDEPSGSSVSNEIEGIEDSPGPETEDARRTRVAEFKLRGYSDLSVDSIDLYARRLRLKNPELSKEEEKAINRVRKGIIKAMNRERRARRAERKEEHRARSSRRKKSRPST